MAFEYFYQQNVDYAIIEVGLGGRLDSTNIINLWFSHYQCSAGSSEYFRGHY
jgi:folylpolyglutamate synthase/dihydropteroate synthase